MNNSGLGVAFFENDPQRNEIDNFFKTVDRDKMARLLDIASRALGTVSKFYRDGSMRMVICSREYIDSIREQTEKMNVQINDEVYAAHIEDEEGLTVGFSVSKNSEVINLLPDPLKEKLGDKVTMAFVEYTTDPDLDNSDPYMALGNFISMLSNFTTNLMHMLDPVVSYKLFECTGNGGGNRQRWIDNCLDAYTEYRYYKFNRVMSSRITEEMFGDKVRTELAVQFAEEVRADRVAKYLNSAIKDLETYNYTDETTKNFARAVGIAEVVGSLKFGSSRPINSNISAKKGRYMDLIAEELDVMSHTYNCVIDKLLKGDFNLECEIDKLKLSDKTIVAFVNKLKITR